MAQQITYWKMDGKSDVELKTVRLKNLSELAGLMQFLPNGCDCITLDRTDNQSNITHEIWHSERYVDLNERN